MSGWVTVFTAFDKDGKWQAKSSSHIKSQFNGNEPIWPIVDSDDIAPGVAEVPVVVDDNGVEHKTVMLGGLPGTNVGANEVGQSVLSPASGWAMFKVPESTSQSGEPVTSTRDAASMNLKSKRKYSRIRSWFGRSS